MKVPETGIVQREATDGPTMPSPAVLMMAAALHQKLAAKPQPKPEAVNG
jgi:hypothetical protein